MKKLLVGLSLLFICTICFAQTINVAWKVGNTTYATNTCEYGGTLTVPSTTPTKYGYTFQGWGAPYTFFEYIESTGTQFIVTGIIGPARWVGSGQSSAIQPKSQCLLGADVRNENGGYIANIYMASQVGVDRKVWELVGKKTTFPTTDYVTYDLDFSIDRCYGTINSENTNTGISDNFTTWNIGICRGLATNYPFVGKIYAQKAYQNDVLVFDGVPARRESDGAIGMYDTVTDRFFENAGTGTFIAGPELQ